MATLEKGKLVDLLTVMVRARVFDEKAMELFTQGLIPGFIHVGLGQEAIAAGVCLNLRHEDSIFITHRGHAQCIAKGISTKRMMAELMGRADGFCKGKAGSMHIADKETGILGASGIVAAGIPVATGAALSYQVQGTEQVAACFFGDGSVNEGAFHEALNMASLWQLPVIYCCENNGWAQFTPQKSTTRILDVAQRAAAYGIPGITVDGDDILAVYEAAGRAIADARQGKGPALLELKTRRWYGHYVGDPQKYRSDEEVAESRRLDPIARFEARLLEQKLIANNEIVEIKEKAQAEIAEAISYAMATPLPQPEAALEDVYNKGVDIR
ncbi:MAG: thiamine pyrophosphate-dependent dehydrogenase E1 component subunit alpha [Chloroflexota bacterium]